MSNQIPSDSPAPPSPASDPPPLQHAGASDGGGQAGAGDGGGVSREELEEAIFRTNGWVEEVRREMGRVLVGQEVLVDRLLIGLLCNGHILLEGLPGLAKTLAVSSLAQAIHLDFSRVQFTPDLLPADLLGTMIYHPEERKFEPKLGPVFANLILADEVNRAPAKVQSALLEAMQERQVTLGERSYALPEPFLVLATQNPIDQEGTYQLPEAQLDRFLLKVFVDYPTRGQEIEILERMATTGVKPRAAAVAGPQQIAASRAVMNEIYMDRALKEYVVDLVHATRFPEKYEVGLKNLIRAGASPRATITLALVARASAYLQGRSYVTPQDIKVLAKDVLRHRILLSYEAEAENKTTDHVIERLLTRVPVP